MKNLIFLLAALVFGTGTSIAAHIGNTNVTFGNSRSFIFTEGDFTFSVYPDGEFDFYLNGQVGFQSRGMAGQGAITFNSGFNYNPYVQYDDFGAVVQISHLPVFYDYYGRVSRIGNIHMTYRSGRLYGLGGMRIYYNGFGYYDYHLGYINPYNRVYVYQPFHRYFVRPAAAYCMVYPQPYRRYYHPVRYTYYRPYHNNVRRAYAQVGKPYKYHSRTERSKVYRNDRRVVARSSAVKPVESGRIAGRTSADRTIRTSRTQRSKAGRATSLNRAKSSSVQNKRMVDSRTEARRLAGVSASSKSVRQRSGAGTTVKQERTSRQAVSRKSPQKGSRSAGIRTSKDKVSRTAPASGTNTRKTVRTSRRSTEY